MPIGARRAARMTIGAKRGAKVYIVVCGISIAPMEMWCVSDGNVVRFSWKCGALLVERGASSGNRGASSRTEQNGGTS